MSSAPVRGVRWPDTRLRLYARQPVSDADSHAYLHVKHYTGPKRKTDAEP